jgi:hypothetical protein
MKITSIKYYGGARDKIARLGLSHLFLELQHIILDTPLLLLEEKDANGAAAVRELIDSKFKDAQGWDKKQSGGIDWKKQHRYNQSVIAKIGVELQVSARSDLVVRDIVHLRNSLAESDIDAGVIVVPSDLMGRFLPDRTPTLRETVKYIEQEFKEAMATPLVIIAIEHDGPAQNPLKKRPRKA